VNLPSLYKLSIDFSDLCDVARPTEKRTLKKKMAAFPPENLVFRVFLEMVPYLTTQERFDLMVARLLPKDVELEGVVVGGMPRRATDEEKTKWMTHYARSNETLASLRAFTEVRGLVVQLQNLAEEDRGPLSTCVRNVHVDAVDDECRIRLPVASLALEECDMLERLRIRGGRGPTELRLASPRLRVVDLYSTDGVERIEFNEDAPLTEVRLEQLDELTALRTLPATVRILHILECRRITGVAIQSAIERLNDLEEVAIRSCSVVTLDAFDLEIKSSLKTLDLYNVIVRHALRLPASLQRLKLTEVRLPRWPEFEMTELTSLEVWNVSFPDNVVAQTVNLPAGVELKLGVEDEDGFERRPTPVQEWPATYKHITFEREERAAKRVKR
jgi:hypothetical protein